MGDCQTVADYLIHANNAAAMWWALAEGHGELLAWTGRVRIVVPSPHHPLRAIVLDADSAVEDTIRTVGRSVLARSDVARRVVEDASGKLDLAPHGFQERFRMTVMLREPGRRLAVRSRYRPGPVTVAGEPGELAAAEQIMDAVFPPPRIEPDMLGRTQPVRVLGIEGWQVWLGRRADVPAGAACTFHDGTSLGIYQVATLPEHRGDGVARAIVEAALADHPNVPVTLTSTEQGRPLYEHLGFRTVSEAVWWIPASTHAPSGGDRAARLR